MRVRMKVKISGTRDGAEWPDKGDTLDVPDDEAEQLIRYGAAEELAVEVDKDADVETATAPATAEKRGRGRPRKE
ncbi:hypothetical protein [Streptomyces sp. NPDC056069]|uniref:hypothetical protein n=1 Tax=Streptomyces sp. NPDC056069 TaxID=3345702 RepID=UPI0035DFF1BD